MIAHLNPLEKLPTGGVHVNSALTTFICSIEQGKSSPCTTVGLQQGASARKLALRRTLTLGRKLQAQEPRGFSVFPYKLNLCKFHFVKSPLKKAMLRPGPRWYTLLSTVSGVFNVF